MSKYVVVEIPNKPEILEGLKNGTLEQVGGVIREAKTGKIVAHLRDVGDLTKILNDFNSQLSHIVNLQYLNLGLGFLNLSVTTISAIYLAKRLNDLEKKLDEVLKFIQEIYTDVKDIKDIMVHHSLLLALKNYDSINLFKDEKLRYNELINVKNNFESSITLLEILMERLLYDIEKNPKRLNELVYIMRLYILATEGLAKVYIDFNELDVTYRKYEISLKNLTNIFSTLKKLALSSPKEIKIPLPPQTRIELKNNVNGIKILKGKTLELEYIDKNNIPFNEWKSLTDGKKENLYFIIET